MAITCTAGARRFVNALPRGSRCSGRVYDRERALKHCCPRALSFVIAGLFLFLSSSGLTRGSIFQNTFFPTHPVIASRVSRHCTNGRPSASRPPVARVIAGLRSGNPSHNRHSACFLMDSRVKPENDKRAPENDKYFEAHSFRSARLDALCE